jgi:hypothetical protein
MVGFVEQIYIVPVCMQHSKMPFSCMLKTMLENSPIRRMHEV